ncbi:phosphotransferase family protein [Paraliomyxa miuraensis]|uniref:phosphotransferase family protein n=1 Tax=Paraliomyxa miuraensis TaxID=376150 RepID=UPI002256B48B|nr:phosphotransferase [Paraliomyxa miuraensis]MCX4240233.1 phosphotransferase [Paraliomyxa miuraensis]
MPGSPARLSLDAVPSVLRARLPEHAVLTAARHGQSASVAFVDGIEGEPLVLKHAAEAPYVTWLRAEAEVLRALADSSLPVPRVMGVHGDESEAWLLLSRLPGEPLVEVLAATREAERPAWFRELGRLLAAIHTTPVPGCLVERDSTPWWQRPRPPLDPARSDDMLSATRLHGAEAPPAVFVHGDFTLDNVLGRDGRSSGVVDWGGAGRGDPRYDVALALTSSAEGRVQLPSPACVAAFYDGYLEVVADADAELHAYFSASR